MKNILPVLFLIILVAGCNTGTSKDTEKAPAAGDKPIPYFTFDEIISYQAGFENAFADTLRANAHRSPEDSIRASILLGQSPQTTEDTAFIASLESMGFRKKKVDTALHREIAFIFSQKPNLGSVKANCPVVLYQQLLIFKKEGRVCGMAKINFRCTQQQITGTSAKTDYFGQNGDYERLEELLTQ